MLRNTKELEGYAIGASDGVIGHVKDFYFDDDEWVIRYLVVETGRWLASRQVLISPIAIDNPDWGNRLLPVSISKEQVRSSPDIDTDKPVSRQHEADHHTYYGYPYYWEVACPGGEDMPANPLPRGRGAIDPAPASGSEGAHPHLSNEGHPAGDPHLRSGAAISGYRLHAVDGDIGHVAGLLVDDRTWAILYLVVATGHWWSGQTVLIAPAWIDEVSWLESAVSVRVTREAVKAAPAYDPDTPLDRQHEMNLYRHYGRRGYWAGAEFVHSRIVQI